MDQITNAEEEIAASIDFTNIRFYRALKRSADEEQDDLVNNGGWERWEDPTNQEKLAEFSAVCFLYAREITQRIGNKVIMKKQEASYFAVWKVFFDFPNMESSSCSESRIFNSTILPSAFWSDWILLGRHQGRGLEPP